jgi:hypothetical protein
VFSPSESFRNSRNDKLGVRVEVCVFIAAGVLFTLADALFIAAGVLFTLADALFIAAGVLFTLADMF